MVSRQPYGSNHFSDSMLFDSIRKLDFTTIGAIVAFSKFRDCSDSNTSMLLDCNTTNDESGCNVFDYMRLDSAGSEITIIIGFSSK